MLPFQQLRSCILVVSRDRLGLYRVPGSLLAHATTRARPSEIWDSAKVPKLFLSPSHETRAPPWPPAPRGSSASSLFFAAVSFSEVGPPSSWRSARIRSLFGRCSAPLRFIYGRVFTRLARPWEPRRSSQVQAHPCGARKPKGCPPSAGYHHGPRFGRLPLQASK